ncbi:methyltransferase family protein [Neptuniibacter halophilus]|uniref:methyltransferase family protein n=1 Tax=Neptuniibacter halophilus TaxID=651666 RepID=UPI002573A498|nr:isoprenylcysteine carboxylmethyltransferase family protein [Neptuniibacter halophilus]
MSSDKGPGVRLPPPLIFIFFIALGLLLDRYWPLLKGWPASGHIPVLVLLICGLGLLAASLYQFWRHKTHVEPWQPASSLICNGIFAYSRNPIYLGFILLTLALGGWLESVWVCLSSLPSTLTLYRYVIVREEAYLERRFGQPYLDYKQRVRRWL